MTAVKAEPGLANEIVVDNLSVGEHRVSFWSRDNLVQSRQKLVVAEGVQASCTVHLRRGIRRPFSFDYPEGDRLSWIQILDAQGHAVSEYSLKSNVERPYRFKMVMPAGSGRISARTHGGLSASREFMTADGDEGNAVVLELR